MGLDDHLAQGATIKHGISTDYHSSQIDLRRNVGANVISRPFFSTFIWASTTPCWG